jgi:glycosyltransferase involved in cell wall biosynthesis
MKVSCILTSFNRPKWVEDAIASVASQTHQDFELIVLDESEEFDILDVLAKFTLPQVTVRKFKVSAADRRYSNRLSQNCNAGLALATGDLVCFLADDDYYYPAWLEKAVRFFEANPEVQAGFGRLVYSYDPHRSYSPKPDPSTIRYYPSVVTEPAGRLDHNQVVHRRFDPPYRWPEAVGTLAGPDAMYFKEIAAEHPFHPIDAFACVKRLHKKSLLESQSIYLGGGMEGLRE